MFKLFENVHFYYRRFFDHLTYDNRLTGIVGPRGVGRTTFLLHQALNHNAESRQALYISADNYYLVDTPLLELVDKLYKETDVRLLCIDEVHPNWNQELKNISDIYRDFKVLFSGSSMIDLIRAKYDLSRRVTIHTLHGLSFREYLEFTFDLKLPVFTLDSIILNHEQLVHDIYVVDILTSING